MGTYYSRFEASNSASSLGKCGFDVKDYRPWIYGVEVDFPGYAENKIIEIFPFTSNLTHRFLDSVDNSHRLLGMI